MEDRSLLQAIGQMLEPLTARLDSLEGKDPDFVYF